MTVVELKKPADEDDAVEKRIDAVIEKMVHLLDREEEDNYVNFVALTHLLGIEVCFTSSCEHMAYRKLFMAFDEVKECIDISFKDEEKDEAGGVH
jgi:hypothetical protein